MELSSRHWLAAVSAAGLLHAGVLSAALWPRPPVDSGTAAVGGVAVSLGAPSAPPSEIIEPVSPMPAALDAVSPADAAEPVAPVDPVDAETLEPTEPVETAVEPFEPPPIDDTPVLDVVEAIPPEELVVEPEVVEDIEMDDLVVETVEVVELTPVPETPPIQPVVEPTPDPEITVAEESIPLPPPPPHRPAAPPPPRVEAAAPDPAPAPQAAPEPVPQIAAIDPSAGPPSPPAAAPATGGGAPGATADYAAQLQAWLERHKEYPRRARQRRQEGVALLYFAIDRSGRVLQVRLQQTTGHDLLDREVLAMVRRAEPLPPMPESMAQQQLELIIPVEFFLR